MTTGPWGGNTSPLIELGPPGVVFKRLTLLIGAVYVTLVAVTNVVDLVAGARRRPLDGAQQWQRRRHRVDHQGVLGAALVRSRRRRPRGRRRDDRRGAVLAGGRALSGQRHRRARGVVGADVERARVARLHR